MRISDRLAAIEGILARDERIQINQVSELDGVINRIERWPEIHRALSILVGYTENGTETPGILRDSEDADYIKGLIARFPPSTENFPDTLFENLQNRIDGLSNDLPVAMHALRQVSPSSSGDFFAAEHRGQLSPDEFSEAVSDIVQIVDILKIKDEITGVWTDSGSSVFGFDIDGQATLLILNAAIEGARQLLRIMSSINPEALRLYFRIFSQRSEAIGEGPLDERIMNDYRVTGESVNRAMEGQSIPVELPNETTPEQQSAMGFAIPRIADVIDRGWNISCTVPVIEGIEIHQSNVTINIFASPNPPAALNPSPGEAGGEDGES